MTNKNKQFKPDKYYFNVLIGDESGDGHSQQMTYLIESSINKDEFQTYYNELCKEFNPFTKYEQNTLNEKEVEYAKKIMSNTYDDLDTEYIFYYDEYAQLLLDLIMKKNSCELKIINLDTVDIGGYGLFS